MFSAIAYVKGDIWQGTTMMGPRENSDCIVKEAGKVRKSGSQEQRAMSTTFSRKKLSLGGKWGKSCGWWTKSAEHK